MASKLGALTGTISDDLQSLTKRDEAFHLTLENAEKYETEHMKQKVQEESKNEQEDIAVAEHNVNDRLHPYEPDALVNSTTRIVTTERKAEDTWSDQETIFTDDFNRTVALATKGASFSFPD